MLRQRQGRESQERRGGAGGRAVPWDVASKVSAVTGGKGLLTDQGSRSQKIPENNMPGQGSLR